MTSKIEGLEIPTSRTWEGEKENVVLKCTINDYLVQDGGFHNVFCEYPMCLSVSYIFDSTHKCLNLLSTTCHVVIGCEACQSYVAPLNFDNFVTWVSEADCNVRYVAKL